MNQTEPLPDARAFSQQCHDDLDRFLTTLESRAETRGTRWVWTSLLAAILRRVAKEGA